MSSRTSQIKEGLNRLCCLIPYDIVTFEVSITYSKDDGCVDITSCYVWMSIMASVERGA